MHHLPLISLGSSGEFLMRRVPQGEKNFIYQLYFLLQIEMLLYTITHVSLYISDLLKLVLFKLSYLNLLKPIQIQFL